MKLSQPERQEMTKVELPTACRRRRKTESLLSDQSRKLRCGLLAAWACYWAIQAGLLTPLTFARHRLSPLAAFTSGTYFLHNGRR